MPKYAKSLKANSTYIGLTRGLHPRLIRFFDRFPPVFPAKPSPIQSTTSDALIEPSTSSSIPTPPSASSNSKILPANDGPFMPSPFRFIKHPITGKWHDPVYSLRRQAELVKLARAEGVEELLPFTVKGTAERIRKREEGGLRVKGTGVGMRVKGKESERTLKGRLEKRRQAMLDMPQMIQTWKERGHGRGWKKWPK